jgi:hypothetical protein
MTITRILFLAGISLLMSSCEQQAMDAEAVAIEYPDWSGQWTRTGSLNWEPEGYAVAGPPPLSPEYQARREEYQELRNQGVLVGDPPATCLPPGMPRLMTMSFPFEMVITEQTSYILADWDSAVRRIYTDGRDWPDYMLPEFNGYSIGQWHDENGDGVYDMLSVETRAIKGPRSFDSTAVVLHDNNETVVLEEFRRIDENTLENTITTIDDALTGPWTVQRNYSHEIFTEDVLWVEYVCAENNRHINLGDQWYFLNKEEGTLDPTRVGQARLVPEN